MTSQEEKYTSLITTISSYVEDKQIRKDIFGKVAEKIDLVQGNEQKMLMIKTYKTAFDTLGKESTEAIFTKIALEVPSKFENMLKNQSENPIPEGEFLTNVSRLAEAMIDQEIFETQYKQTGLSDNKNTKLVYQIFLDDVDVRFDKIKEQLETQLALQPDIDPKELYNSVEKAKTQLIKDHVKASIALQNTEASEKAITPFTVFSSLYGQEDSQEELKEALTGNETYYTESTIWGAYNIIDNMQSVVAKDSMFQIAVVPLTAPNANDEKQDTKVIPLPKAMEHYQKNNDQQGIQAALQTAVVPLTHSSGEQMIFPLKAVFDKIDAEPEYRQHVLEDVQTGLPIPFINLLEEMSLSKILSPGKAVSTSTDDPVKGVNAKMAAEYQKILAPTETKIIEAYVSTLNNMQPSEDTVSSAEYLMANSVVALDNAMQVPNSLKPTPYQSDYYETVSTSDDEHGHVSNGMIKVSAVQEKLDKAIDTFQAINTLFIAPSEDLKTKDLNPLFTNTDKKLQEELKSALEQADMHLGALLPQLENLIKKEIEAKQSQQKANNSKKKGNGLGN